MEQGLEPVPLPLARLQFPLENLEWPRCSPQALPDSLSSSLCWT